MIYTDFKTLDLSQWVVSNWGAPGGGTFSPANVSLISGCLALKLSQTKNANGSISSVGAELQYKNLCGLGAYEWVVRMGSTATTPTAAGNVVSGGISGLFNFVNNSQTEIDFEVEGQNPQIMWLTNWMTTANKQGTSCLVSSMAAQFRTYRFVWAQNRIDFYVDGVQAGSHTQYVPVAPAYPMINHWGTNSNNWGGFATPGVDRYLYVQSFSYTPS